MPKLWQNSKTPIVTFFFNSKLKFWQKLKEKNDKNSNSDNNQNPNVRQISQTEILIEVE